MGCYNYTHFVKEFADRTRINLGIIDRTGSANGAKEVTQLINSLLGLLIVPNERYKFINKDTGCSEDDLKGYDQESYGNIKKMISILKSQSKLYNDYPGAKKFPVGDFVVHIRNAICHSGKNTLLFLPIAENEEIATIIFYDTDEGRNNTKHEFCVEMSIEQIREFVKFVSTMYIAIETQATEAWQNHYIETANEYKKLLKNNK